MTQRDKWTRRPEVLRYRAWADVVRLAGSRVIATFHGGAPGVVSVVAYFPMPTSWPAKRQAAMKGQPHRVKPDGDNVLKGLLDALVRQDQRVYEKHIVKRWDDGSGPRVVVEVSE